MARGSGSVWWSSGWGSCSSGWYDGKLLIKVTIEYKWERVSETLGVRAMKVEEFVEKWRVKEMIKVC